MVKVEQGEVYSVNYNLPIFGLKLQKIWSAPTEISSIKNSIKSRVFSTSMRCINFPLIYLYTRSRGR